MNRTQKQMIAEHLRRFGTIEPLTALREYGCYRLSARIGELREDAEFAGRIRTTKVEGRSRITGRRLCFAQYTLTQPEA